MDKFHELSFYSCPMDIFIEFYTLCVRWTDPANLTIGQIFTAYLRLANKPRHIHQSYHLCPMDRIDESFHSSRMDGPTDQTICVLPDIF